MVGLDSVLSPLAYGPAPGLEFLPYFLGLLAWAGLALAAVLLSPISALLRRLRKTKSIPQAESMDPPIAVSVPETSGEGKHDNA